MSVDAVVPPLPPFACIVTVVLGWLAHRLMATPGLRALGIGLLVVLTLQVLLGLANVWFSLPLSVAVAHNGGAALLLALLVMLNFQVARARLQI